MKLQLLLSKDNGDGHGVLKEVSDACTMLAHNPERRVAIQLPVELIELVTDVQGSTDSFVPMKDADGPVGPTMDVVAEVIPIAPALPEPMPLDKPPVI